MRKTVPKRKRPADYRRVASYRLYKRPGLVVELVLERRLSECRVG